MSLFNGNSINSLVNHINTTIENEIKDSSNIATTTSAGLMSSADKVKLNDITISGDELYITHDSSSNNIDVFGTIRIGGYNKNNNGEDIVFDTSSSNAAVWATLGSACDLGKSNYRFKDVYADNHVGDLVIYPNYDTTKKAQSITSTALGTMSVNIDGRDNATAGTAKFEVNIKDKNQSTFSNLLTLNDNKLYTSKSIESDVGTGALLYSTSDHNFCNATMGDYTNTGFEIFQVDNNETEIFVAAAKNSNVDPFLSLYAYYYDGNNKKYNGFTITNTGTKVYYGNHNVLTFKDCGIVFHDTATPLIVNTSNNNSSSYIVNGQITNTGFQFDGISYNEYGMSVFVDSTNATYANSTATFVLSAARKYTDNGTTKTDSSSVMLFDDEMQLKSNSVKIGSSIPTSYVEITGNGIKAPDYIESDTGFKILNNANDYILFNGFGFGNYELSLESSTVYHENMEFDIVLTSSASGHNGGTNYGFTTNSFSSFSDNDIDLGMNDRPWATTYADTTVSEILRVQNKSLNSSTNFLTDTPISVKFSYNGETYQIYNGLTILEENVDNFIEYVSKGGSHVFRTGTTKTEIENSYVEITGHAMYVYNGSGTGGYTIFPSLNGLNLGDSASPGDTTVNHVWIESAPGQSGNSAIDMVEEFRDMRPKTITKNLNISTSWIDTGISGTNIVTDGDYGSFIIQAHIGSSNLIGTWTGIMSWYSGSYCEDADTNEIVLHKAGPCTSGIDIYLRTIGQNNGAMKLQIASNVDLSASAISVQFKFRRLF